SFYRTICCMRPAKKGSTINEASVELFRQQMPQATFKLQGFPLALQLVAFRACPLLPSKLPKDSDHPTLLEWTTVPFSKGNALSHSDVIEIEFSDALTLVDQYRSESHEDVPTYPIHTELDNLMDVDEIDPQEHHSSIQHKAILKTTTLVQTQLHFYQQSITSSMMSIVQVTAISLTITTPLQTKEDQFLLLTMNIFSW
ncbi:hypothetical protein EUTSA_v10012358mg, partial [Eutrema salsugineum]